MSKTQRAYTPEQERAMAIARVERQMTAADVVKAAQAGELDGLPSFDPSVSTVDRCAKELEAQQPTQRHLKLIGRSYDLLDALAREIEAEQEKTGKVNPIKTRQLTQALRNMGATSMPRARNRPEDETVVGEVDAPEDSASPLLTRLGAQHGHASQQAPCSTAQQDRVGAAS